MRRSFGSLVNHSLASSVFICYLAVFLVLGFWQLAPGPHHKSARCGRNGIEQFWSRPSGEQSVEAQPSDRYRNVDAGYVKRISWPLLVANDARRLEEFLWRSN